MKNQDNTSRYILGIDGEKPLVCIGINPSTTEPEKLDNTVKSVERIARYNGYDSWIMINIYPQIATDPNDLTQVRDYSLYCKNISSIEDIFKKIDPDIWAAWGTLINKRTYLPSCLVGIVRLSKKHSCKGLCAGLLSKDGHPHHPLYLKKNSELKPFDIEGYLEKISDGIDSNKKPEGKTNWI